MTLSIVYKWFFHFWYALIGVGNSVQPIWIHSAKSCRVSSWDVASWTISHVIILVVTYSVSMAVVLVEMSFAMSWISLPVDGAGYLDKASGPFFHPTDVSYFKFVLHGFLFQV